jgi:superoxide dismutase, Fe-Mn family
LKGWLGYDKVGKRLVVTSTANQDPLFATTGLVPILGIDVWEHAYYLVVSIKLSICLKRGLMINFNSALTDYQSTTYYSSRQYKNVRPDYVKHIWKIINWADCAERLAEAKK